MQQPKVSVIVPCWGVEKYLDKCVESIVNQTLHDIEIILVDDVSPDRVPEMCNAWAQKDSRIKVIHKAKNEGLGMACNTGIDAATGEYIAFCDSDDWVDADMYETMYMVAEEHNADAVISGLKRVNNDGEKVGVLAHYTDTVFLDTKQYIQELALNMIAAAPKCKEERTIQASAKVVLYRKSLIEEHKIRFYSEREVPSEDMFFNLNILNHASRIVVLSHHFYNYRITPSSISQGVTKDYFENRLLLLYKCAIKECNDLCMGKEAKIRVLRLLIGYIRVYVCRVCNSKWSKTEKMKIITKIAQNEIWDDVKYHYPVHDMPFTHKLFYKAIIHNKFHILSILSLYKK